MTCCHDNHRNPVRPTWRDRVGVWAFLLFAVAVFLLVWAVTP